MRELVGLVISFVAIACYVAAFIAWIWMGFWGPSLTNAPDCDPRALGGCGLIDIGLTGMVRLFVENIFNLLPTIALATIGYLLMLLGRRLIGR